MSRTEFIVQLDRAVRSHPELNLGSFDDLLADGSPYDLLSLTPAINKDLKKVNFDGENVMFQPGQSNYGDRLNMHTLDNELQIFGVASGGDWETPVFWIIYPSPDGLRAYVPKEGNAWNYDSKEALGNDEEADERFARKLYPPSEDEEVHAEDLYDRMVDTNALTADILGRLKSADVKTTAKTNVSPVMVRVSAQLLASILVPVPSGENIGEMILEHDISSRLLKEGPGFLGTISLTQVHIVGVEVP